MKQVYIGTYHEDGKEPVQYTISQEELDRLIQKGESEESLKERLLSILRQSKKRGFWTARPARPSDANGNERGT